MVTYLVLRPRKALFESKELPYGPDQIKDHPPNGPEDSLESRPIHTDVRDLRLCCTNTMNLISSCQFLRFY